MFAGFAWMESPNTMFCLRFSGESNIGRRTLVSGSLDEVGFWFVMLLDVNRCHIVGRGRTVGAVSDLFGGGVWWFGFGWLVFWILWWDR